ncbi:MAG: HAMP domain-containing protein [Cyanobacteria bacterium P01_D01_bin.1]
MQGINQQDISQQNVGLQDTGLQAVDQPDVSKQDVNRQDIQLQDIEQTEANRPNDQPDIKQRVVSQNGISLRARLLQTILPAVLLPLICADFVGYRIVAQRSTAQLKEQLTNQALLASEGTVAVLDDLLDLPKSIADSPLVVNEARAGSREAEAAGLPGKPIDEVEAEFADTKLLRQHEALNNYLRQTVETAEISEILVTDSHGFNVAYSRPVADIVQSDEAWWQNGRDNQQWIGPPDFDFASKGFTVELVQSILDPQNDDQFVGVIRAVLPTRKFSLLADSLQRTGITQSQRVQLIDGETLSTIDTFSAQGFHKDRNIIGGEPVEQLIAAFVAATQAGTESSQQQILLALQEIRDQQPGIRRLSLPIKDEATAVASFMYEDRQYKIANIPASSWVAISSMEQSEISAAGRDSLLFFSLITLLLGAIMTVLIFWLSRQLAQPISRLTEQAKVVAAGNLEVAVEPTGTTETWFLTQTFNQLVTQVRELIGSQQVENQKVQLLAEVASASILDRSEIIPLVARILPTARDILAADRLVFFQTAKVEAPLTADSQTTDSQRSNSQTSKTIDITRRQGWIVSESASSELQPASSYPETARWLPAEVLALLEETGPSTISLRSSQNVDSEHRTFLQDEQIADSLNVPVFYEYIAKPSQASNRTVNPNKTKPRIWGYLIAHSRSDRDWEEDDIQFLERLATQLKQVLDRVAADENIKKSYQAVKASQQETAVATRAQQQQTERVRQQEQRLQREVAALSRDISGVFQGDLTVRAGADKGDLKTVADVFNTTVTKLEELVTKVKDSSTEIDDILIQNEQSAEQLVQLTQQQRQEAAQTLETMQTVSQSVDDVVSQAQAAASSAERVSDRAQSSKVAIDQVSKKIHGLNSTSNSAINKIHQLTRSSKNVSYMVAMISSIATDIQTLAQQTDSTIESWSAKGELDPSQQQMLTKTTADMTKLAEQSLAEATLIETFLNSVGQTTQQVAESIEQINQDIIDGNQAMQISQTNLSEVLLIAEQFEQLAQTVADAAKGQSHVSHQASELVAAIVNLSEQTSRFSAEMARSLQNTATTAHDLRSSVDFFKVHAH